MNKSKLVRKASPPRQETENTFMKKLEQLRQQRQNGGSKKRKLIVNGKEAMDHQGDWALFESSKGRKYYFNIKTQSNQWVKPEEWIEKSKNNVISDSKSLLKRLNPLKFWREKLIFGLFSREKRVKKYANQPYIVERNVRENKRIIRVFLHVFRFN